MRTSALSDVAIIGGGIVGTAAAALLSTAGVRVTLYESGATVAAAASGRNAGSIVHPPDPILGRLYSESLERYRRLAGERLGPGEAFHVPAEPGGVLAVAFDGDLVRRVAQLIGAAQPGLSTEILEGAAVRAAEPLLADGLTAFRLATGYSVRPADATRAFAALAVRSGAIIRTGARARPWIEGGVARGVEVADTRVPAGWVLVAAGPWTPDVVDPLGTWRPIRPLWGVIVEIDLAKPPTHVIEELADEQSLTLAGPAQDDPNPRIGSAPRNEDLPRPVLMVNPGAVPVGGGRAPTALGGTLAPVEPDAGRVAPTLIQHARSFLPAIARAQSGIVRSCARPQSSDARPLVGFVPGIERLVVAAGNGGWGISTGPATARLAVDVLVAGSDRAVPPELRADRYRGPAGPVDDYHSRQTMPGAR